ncbi:FOG: TPR repeat SEL1 subfamily-like protein [Pseudooceanicola batsensis HTCC2597]|uniref:FOG: TPR repeat SEL1 subfamily-like protein n=1 Tax=Pseudooceanicola batsensis (strain ATCC BAA-863 / DSM 15984 / KCTC 12145 / HTCC2597) TaxID=252305 RepID=A3TX53_PSEBH|nr:SEL1-like repeat protein [Pseudooceanicola batsensis]EAQ03413.1 FOG: TPR repeat SEL1 subfamily-like protein [Pseudooceanicola batsensis HTCC2597]
MRIPRIVPCPSPGASALILALLGAPGPLLAQYADGEAAYAARDWAAARDLWTEEARQGSARAVLGLGNLRDFGLLGPPDPAGAFDLYAQAARLGLPEAAFNVAVMRDSGTGVAMDRRAAAAWYSFAAVAGHARAAYNLGLLHAEGNGLPQNPALAGYWLDAAGPDVPAAAKARDALPEAIVGALTAPDPLGALRVDREGGQGLRVAWASAPTGQNARFVVQVALVAEAGAVPLDDRTINGSATEIDLPKGAEILWRVATVRDGSYAASPWQDMAGDAADRPPSGRLVLETRPGDRRAAALAQRLGPVFGRAGVMVSYREASGDGSEGFVRFGYAPDREFAADIATVVPGVERVDREAAGSAPGEVVVRLVFDGDAASVGGEMNLE